MKFCWGELLILPVQSNQFVNYFLAVLLKHKAVVRNRISFKGNVTAIALAVTIAFIVED